MFTFFEQTQMGKRPLIDNRQFISVWRFPHSAGTVLAFNLVSNHINGGRRRQRRSFSSNLLLHHHMGPSEDSHGSIRRDLLLPSNRLPFKCLPPDAE